MTSALGGFRPAPLWLLTRFDARMGLVGQLVAAATVVLIGTITAAILYHLFDLTRLAIYFLGSVIVCALFFGTRPAVFAAFLAFLAYNFSLVEPRFTLHFAGPDDALTLAAFLIVALLVGSLAGRVRESERVSRRRADQLETLLNASRAFGSETQAEPVKRRLRQTLSNVAGAEAFVLDLGAPPPLGVDAPVDQLFDRVRSGGDLIAFEQWRAKSIDDQTLAVWQSGDEGRPGGRAQDRLCALIAELAAASLDRIRLVDLQAEAQADLRAGKLRDAILGSISHDLRTPLATVLASASSLRDYDERFDSKTRRDLAGAIVEEAERLNSYLQNLLDLSRIEAGYVAPRLGKIPLLETIDAAVRRADPTDVRNIRVSVPDMAEVRADGQLLEQAIFNLIDNALLHGGQSAQVDIQATVRVGRMEITVEDDGPGVPEDEHALLFEKFYRGRSHRLDVRGTGVGLAVAKGFIEAMGGSISASRSRGASRGLRIEIVLLEPLARPA